MSSKSLAKDSAFRGNTKREFSNTLWLVLLWKKLGANRKCICELFTLTVWEGMWDEWALLFSGIASPWMLAQGVHSSRALGTCRVWVAVIPLLKSNLEQKFFFKFVNSGITSLCLIISTTFSPLRTSHSVFSLTVLILGKTMSKEGGIHVASNTSFSPCLWGERTLK